MLMQEKIKIAIIDDDEDDFLLISDCIKDIYDRDFVIDWYRNYDTAIDQIRLKSYHIYFVDYFLDGKTGLDLLKQAAAIKFDRPIILLTGFGSREIDEQAMKSGATDYLIKSEITAEKMERCIRYSLQRTTFLEELKSREAKYRTLFEGSKDAVFIADTRLFFIEVNNAGNALLETKDGTLFGNSLYDFIDNEVQKARIRDLVKSWGKIDDLEIKIKKINSEVRTCLLSLYVLNQDESSAIVHGIIRDITDMRKAEQANALAEKMQANERLARVLAHEIRNPLNNILLSVEMLLPDVNEEGHKNLLGIMERNSLRINNIISELLSLTNHGQLSLEKLSLQIIMEESLKLASDRLQLQKILVEKDYPENPIIISADKSKLVLAFTNILINAAEAMEVEKGRLNIHMTSAKGIHTTVIKDNGRGIPKEHLSKLFEPLFTLKKNGLGLGLTASYSIMQAHKANMHVESTEGEGTSFFIQFEDN